MKIQILIDNSSSWMFDFILDLHQLLLNDGHHVNIIDSHANITSGDILLLLSCEQKLINFSLNKRNLVIHASDLPKGKGWSPLTWQILFGASSFPVVILEADDKIDNGVIYDKEMVLLSGTELIHELRKKLFEAIKKLTLNFVEKYPNNLGKVQTGEVSYYKKRTQNDSQLDINKSLKSQFDLLRVVDNERYPAFINYKGRKYILKIYQDENQ